MVRIRFIGGARTVTGSCFIVEGSSGNLMVDCGMFQGPEELEALNWKPLEFKPSEVERLVLTHAHIDHSGLIPRICKLGFKGDVFCTYATADLAGLMLPDSGHIQEREADWENKKRLRRGENFKKALYTQGDAEKCVRQFKGVPYDAWNEIGGGFKVRFRDAGHILGSAIIELDVQDNGEWKRIVFSGDLGNIHPPILREPSNVEGGRLVVCESTYGSRIHEPAEEKKRMLAEVVNEAFHHGGKVLIPAFAIGRTQEIIYILNELLRENAIPHMPVYIDSPLAISGTEIFLRHPECYDEETKALINSGTSFLDFPGLRLTRDLEESKAINEEPGPAIIIAASGMCEAGRIKHHLMHNLFKPNAHIVFVGFQAAGTLGRLIRDGVKYVKILNEHIAVKAKIHSIGAFSAHADREGLSNWLAAMKRRPEMVCVVHGEDREALGFAEYAKERIGLAMYVPSRGEEIDLDHLPEVTKELPAFDISGKGLIDEILQLHNQTSDLSGHLARLRDLLQTRVISLDEKTVENLRGICRSLGVEAGQLMDVIAELDAKDEIESD